MLHVFLVLTEMKDIYLFSQQEYWKPLYRSEQFIVTFKMPYKCQRDWN